MSKSHEIFSWSFGEKQLEMTLGIPLIPPTTWFKNNQRAFLGSDGLSFKGNTMQKGMLGSLAQTVQSPVINLWPNVPMRICLQKVNAAFHCDEMHSFHPALTPLCKDMWIPSTPHDLCGHEKPLLCRQSFHTYLIKWWALT